MKWSSRLFWTFIVAFLLVIGATAVLLAAMPHSWRLGESAAALLFLPAALLLAGGAALILFRRLSERLRQLEEWATGVEKGDLKTGVPGPKDDEIGRLGARLHRMATRLAKTRARLKAVDQQRRRLLADISHELATPLTSIRASAETLLDTEVPMTTEEQRQTLDDLLGEAQRMDLLIKDLFDLTRLESNATRLVREHLDWAALCRNTVARYQARFAEAGLELRSVGSSRPAWVHADGRRLEQVLENLLANSLRYATPPGTVTVGIETMATETVATEMADTEKTDTDTSHRTPRHRLQVADDGPGIPTKDLAHIFDRFYRSNRDRSSPGSGLGLAIVKEFVERHGGTVEAGNRNPQSGSGAVVRIEMPAVEPPP